MSPHRGRFVVFEGGEGCGKSTQAERLATRLGAVLTREPGGTPLGGRLRALLLDRATTGLAPKAEALLMAADRAQHVAGVIEPSLSAGRHVVCDRYLYSSVAYQGFGRGLGAGEIAALSRFAVGSVLPDIVILLDLDPRLAATRLHGERDRFETEPPAFHDAVRSGFLAQAAEDPGRWVVLDASATVDEVTDAVNRSVESRW
ncbi:MAG: dTMP kinase [Microthrixaceae bacterium]